MAGQYLDVLAQVRGVHSVEAALRVARFKSGKYSVERPLQFGAAVGGAGEETIQQLGAFGLPLGEAFQLRDDVLGVFGRRRPARGQADRAGGVGAPSGHGGSAG
jgi:geranylgeranyl diphosphate synthase type I